VNSIPPNEYFRKFLHLFSSIIPLGYFLFFPKRGSMVLILGGLSFLAVLIEYSRRNWSAIETSFEKYFNFMMRQNEFEGTITGATWLLFGSTLTILLFPIHIAVPALLFLTVGDTFAAIVGKSIPIGKIGEKSLSGTFAGIVTSSGVALMINQIIPSEIIIFGAVVAMVVEILPIPMNDNLTIPLAGGLTMHYGMMTL